MKRTITSVITMMTALFASANHQNSELSLSSRNNDLISVIVDNRQVLQPDRDVEISGLAAGEHLLTVRKVSMRHGMMQQSRILYIGKICIPEESRVTAVLENRNRLNITDVEPLCISVPSWNPAPHSNPLPVCGPVTMNAFAFDQLKRSITSKTFESTKLVVAQQAAAGNFFTSCQVSELLSLFTFESTRVEFAECAYHRTVDKQMYFLVNDAFTFASSIDELNDYILHNS